MLKATFSQSKWDSDVLYLARSFSGRFPLMQSNSLNRSFCSQTVIQHYGKSDHRDPMHTSSRRLRKTYLFVFHTEVKYRLACSGKHGLCQEQFVLQGNYEPIYSKQLTLHAGYTFYQKMHPLGIKPVIWHFSIVFEPSI